MTKSPKWETYSAPGGTVGALVVNTLAASLLLSRVAVILPQVRVDMWLGRVDNLVHRLHLTTLSFPLVLWSYAWVLNAAHWGYRRRCPVMSLCCRCRCSGVASMVMVWASIARNRRHIRKLKRERRLAVASDVVVHAQCRSWPTRHAHACHRVVFIIVVRVFIYSSTQVDMDVRKKRTKGE